MSIVTWLQMSTHPTSASQSAGKAFHGCLRYWKNRTCWSETQLSLPGRWETADGEELLWVHLTAVRFKRLSVLPSDPAKGGTWPQPSVTGLIVDAFMSNSEKPMTGAQAGRATVLKVILRYPPTFRACETDSHICTHLYLRFHSTFFSFFQAHLGTSWHEVLCSRTRKLRKSLQCWSEVVQ